MNPQLRHFELQEPSGARECAKKTLLAIRYSLRA
jgi:hypothetical protein